MELQLVPTGMEEVTTWSCYWCQQAWKKSLHGTATGINRHARWPWPGNEASLGCQVTIPRMWGVGIRLDYRYIVLSPDQIFHLVERLTEKQGWTLTKKTRVVSNCRWQLHYQLPASSSSFGTQKVASWLSVMTVACSYNFTSLSNQISLTTCRHAHIKTLQFHQWTF